MERPLGRADAPGRAMDKSKPYADVLDDEDDGPGDIDMDRVVADPAYRRRLIDRLRRERLEVRARRAAPDAPADEDD